MHHRSVFNPQSAIRKRQSSRLFLPGDGLEVAVDLFLVSRRRVVVGAGGKPVFRLLRLDFFRQRRFHGVERLRRLASHVFPLREVLLERFSAGCRQSDAARRLERHATAAAARHARILAAHLIDKCLCLLQLTLVLLAQLIEVGCGAAAALLALTRSAGVAGGLLRARSRRAALAALAPAARLLAALPLSAAAARLVAGLPGTTAGCRLFTTLARTTAGRRRLAVRSAAGAREPIDVAARAVQLVAQFLRPRPLLRELLRFVVAATAGRRQLVRRLVERAREFLRRRCLRARIVA